jgi:hypothetical protein
MTSTTATTTTTTSTYLFNLKRLHNKGEEVRVEAQKSWQRMDNLEEIGEALLKEDLRKKKHLEYHGYTTKNDGTTFNKWRQFKGSNEGDGGNSRMAQKKEPSRKEGEEGTITDGLDRS